MRQILKSIFLVASLCGLIVGAGFAPQSQTAAQAGSYLDPQGGREYEEAVILPAGARRIPVSLIVPILITTDMSSKHARIGDRFFARTLAPIVNRYGSILVPAATIVEGTVADVSRASWPRKAGRMSVIFTRMRVPSGRYYTIRGTLVNIEDGDKLRLEDELGLKPEPTVARDAVIIGGSATGGAVVGMLAGSALAGAGIGAAAGIATVLLLPGKNVELKRGMRFGMQFLRAVWIGGYYGRCIQCPLGGTVYDYPRGGTVYEGPRGGTVYEGPRGGTVYEGPRGGTVMEGPRGGTVIDAPPTQPVFPLSDTYPSSSLTSDGLVDVSDVRVERSSDGAIYILLTAETPSTGWQVSTKHNVSADTVQVGLYGSPPSNGSTRQVSHPTPSPIVIPDRSGNIRRVTVQAKNGPRTIEVSSSSRLPDPNSSITPGSSRPVLRPSPSRIPSSGYVESPRPAPSTQARRIANQVEKIRYDFGANVNVWISPDGSYDVSNTRKLTDDEQLLLDRTGSLLKSLRDYDNQSAAPSRNELVGRIREDTQVIKHAWGRVRMSNDLNQRFRSLFYDVQMLVGSTSSPTSRMESPNPQLSEPVTGRPRSVLTSTALIKQ